MTLFACGLLRDGAVCLEWVCRAGGSARGCVWFVMKCVRFAEMFRRVEVVYGL